jgi:hypothetical protein
VKHLDSSLLFIVRVRDRLASSAVDPPPLQELLQITASC